VPSALISPTRSGPATQSDPLVGALIGHYTIVSKIGVGGQGVVYLAHDTKLERPVALKLLPAALGDDECARQRFLREAQTASAIQHPHICTIYGIESTDDGQPFIVMAYYEGPTLRQKMRDRDIFVSDAIEIAAQIAEGLAAAHARGVVHRDVKPGNLILTDQGIKILDFGLARFVGSADLTTQGSVVGTASYMSPEQTRCQSADFSSDVWATGIVLYEMLAGTPPFTGSHSEAICYAIRHDTPPPLPTSAVGITKRLERIVLQALSKNPGRRQTAHGLAGALRQLQQTRRALTERRSSSVPSDDVTGRFQSWRSLVTRLTPRSAPSAVRLRALH
jgi:eukaryotic-like serine/threonine-protein kinase